MTLAAQTLGLLGNLDTDSTFGTYTVPGLVAAALGLTATLVTTALPHPNPTTRRQGNCPPIQHLARV